MLRWFVANLVADELPSSNVIACSALSWFDSCRLLVFMHVCSPIGIIDYNRFSAFIGEY